MEKRWNDVASMPTMYQSICESIKLACPFTTISIEPYLMDALD